MDKDTLRELGGWMGFVGVVTIIGGVISAIGGLFAFVIGAIPGIMAIILGVKLRKAKQNTETLLANPEDDLDLTQLNLLTANLKGFFKLQGILIIVSIVYVIIVIVVPVVFGASMFEKMLHLQESFSKF